MYKSYFLKTPQRFPTEDHLMIHRHKHEMTLKFPSIKNDNMLSGELRLHQCRLTHYLSRVHGALAAHLQVCALVTHAQRHLSIIRKFLVVSIPVVYSNVNHMTHTSGRCRDADVWLEESARWAKFLFPVALCDLHFPIIRDVIRLELTIEPVEDDVMDGGVCKSLVTCRWAHLSTVQRNTKS